MNDYISYGKSFISNYFGLSKDLDYFNDLDLHKLNNLMNEEISAYEYKANDSNKYFFIVEGYESNKELLEKYKGLKDFGYNLVFIGYTRQIVYGLKESLDLLVWLDYFIKRNKDIDIYLLGIKEGCNIITKSLKSAYPDNVKALILDNILVNPAEHYLNEYTLLNQINHPLLHRVVDYQLNKRFNISFVDMSNNNDLNNNRIPALFIFDKSRKEEEYKDVLRLYNNNPSFKNFFYSPGINDEKYLKSLDVFVKKLNSL